MFYQNDYITRTLKEREIKERVQQAATDHLVDELDANRSGLVKQTLLTGLHATGHLFSAIGNGLQAIGANKRTVRRPSA